MRSRNFNATLLLVAAVVAIFPLTSTYSQENGPAASPTPVQSKKQTVQPQLRVFADRETLKVGEEIHITVWIESQATDSVVVKPFFAPQQLQLAGSTPQTVPLPQGSPLTFTLKGVKPGKSNFFVEVSGRSKDKNEPLTASQQVKGIEVREEIYSLKSILSNSLFGALFGALLTVAATFLNDYRQRRKEATQRKLWLTASLPAQIELDRLAVTKSQKADPDVWLSKMMTEGIYKDVQELTRNRPDFKTLVNDLIEAGALLREYEKVRAENRAGLSLRQEVSGRLENVINMLRAL